MTQFILVYFLYMCVYSSKLVNKPFASKEFYILDAVVNFIIVLFLRLNGINSLQNTHSLKFTRRKLQALHCLALGNKVWLACFLHLHHFLIFD